MRTCTSVERMTALPGIKAHAAYDLCLLALRGGNQGGDEPLQSCKGSADYVEEQPSQGCPTGLAPFQECSTTRELAVVAAVACEIPAGVDDRCTAAGNTRQEPSAHKPGMEQRSFRTTASWRRPRYSGAQ